MIRYPLLMRHVVLTQCQRRRRDLMTMTPMLGAR
jgi:hypothetical protein